MDHVWKDQPLKSRHKYDYVVLGPIKSKRWDLMRRDFRCEKCGCYWPDLSKHSEEECLLSGVHDS